MNTFEDLHIKLDLKRYPNSIFFFKEDKFWMEYNWKNKILWCRWEGLWEVLRRENRWKDWEVQAFIKNQVEQRFKCKGVAPVTIKGKSSYLVEEHFEVKGITPYPRRIRGTQRWKNISN